MCPTASCPTRFSPRRRTRTACCVSVILWFLAAPVLAGDGFERKYPGAEPQPVDCTLSSEDSPAYDGCSVPQWTKDVTFPVTPALSLIVTLWQERFAHPDLVGVSRPAPCYLHDLCYAHGEITYGFQHQQNLPFGRTLDNYECDERFKTNMIAVCNDLPWWRLIRYATCREAAFLFRLFLRQYHSTSKQSCCAYLESGSEVLTEECQEAYEATRPEVRRPPDPETCALGEEGCLCAAVDTYSEPSDEAYHPDGDFAIDKYCPDDEGELVCVTELFSLVERGICRNCELPKAPGCRCSSEEECGPGLSCYGVETQGGGGTGHCYSSDRPPPWACLADCRLLLNNDLAYCYHDHQPGGPRCLTPLCKPFDADMCFKHNLGVCDNSGDESCTVLECDCEGTHCGPESTTCQDLGYPPSYRCNIGTDAGICTTVFEGPVKW